MVAFSRPIFFSSHSFPVPIRTVRFHVTNIDRRGVNTVNPSPFLRIITNDKKASLTESVYQSMSKYLNKKFKVSLLLTHFFKLQKVIPKRIQHKYFTFLRDSLYKRLSIIDSRFILGIFIPCCYPGTFLSSSPDLKDNTCCTLPTPIVYSRYNDTRRVGCGLHNKFIPKYSKPSNNSTLTPAAQRTAALVKIHQQWSSQSTNHVYSTRRGLSYSTKISATSEGLIIYHNNGFSFKPRTLEKQAQRRQCFERRILKHAKSTVLDNPNQPMRSPTKKFLFTKHKYVCDSARTIYWYINHLREGVHDKRPHLMQYLPIKAPSSTTKNTRITRANRDEIEYVPLPEDVCSKMRYEDYVKYKDFFPLKPVFSGKGKRRFALSPDSDNWWRWVKDRYRIHQEELEQARIRPCFPDWNTTHDRYRYRLDNWNYLMKITNTVHSNYEFSTFNKTLRDLTWRHKKSKRTPTWRCLEHWRLLTEQSLDGDSYPGSSARFFNMLKPDPHEHDHTYDPEEFRFKRPFYSPLYSDYHYHLVRPSKRPCFNFDHMIIK
ncbi:hypothetical protein GLOIN_2v474654 [Rhizophagus clarus]|uniref:DUF8211 domain-containing protein n=1 Tax=Rhizophagus clarus TaxID=94130 RepID=A0A8H3R1K1_9GLOM|nr:hypothetical protein GLOIN_2v474654 [Rhizophagus clarus]